jgi:hypothetical protein
MSKIFVYVVYLSVVWVGSIFVDDVVHQHHFNVARQQLADECEATGQQFRFICKDGPKTVEDRVRENLQDD